MLIGVDFDNTIVRYDRLFHKAAVERGFLPAGPTLSKDQVRDAMRQAGREEDWIELQGYVYGPCMKDAELFPGVADFFAACRERGVPVRVISHRTARPFRGPPHDLHEAARGFLRRHGFLKEDEMFFELTKQAKLERIKSAGCTHFIDDLPEFLGEAAFPDGVEKFLFDPAGLHADAPGLRRVSSWAEAAELLLGPAQAPRLAAAAGLTGALRVTPVDGAANNRVFRVEAGGKRALLKAYFRHPDDPRDRLGAEYAFSAFAWERGLRALPKPLASDPASGLAVYEFVDGQRPASASAQDVAEALAFYRALNEHRREPAARVLPEASEACFSLAAHLDVVGRRVARLAALDASGGAGGFARGELAGAWRETAAKVRASGLDLDAVLPADERRLSPSDFGFHNALRGGDGRLRFLDFEYAGWDDPARVVGDFFCQPAVPAPMSSYDGFARGVAEGLPDPELHRARMDALLPVYRVKWCCILLNDFLPVGGERRRFARRAPVSDQTRDLQLDKARRLLAAGGRA